MKEESRPQRFKEQRVLTKDIMKEEILQRVSMRDVTNEETL
jgi:hypothetical protein